MKAIIDGKTYNTETATPIGGTIGPRDTFAGDFRDWSATLYRTKKGRYFMAGRGGAMSPFAEPYGQNGSQGGNGIRALSAEDALAYAEKYLDPKTIAEHFADVVEDA